MKKIVLAVSIAMAQLLAVNAIAQSKGTADPEQSKAIPAKAATKAEKADAKAARKAAGKQVKAETPGAADEAMNKTTGAAKAATKEEKAAAKTVRKTTSAEALKKGEIPKGEMAPVAK